MTPTIALRTPPQPTHYKTPAEHLDYPWDFSDVLDPVNDTIASFVITLDPALDRYAADYNDDTHVVAFVSAGGTPGQLLPMDATITTVDARIFQRRRWLAIVDTR